MLDQLAQSPSKPALNTSRDPKLLWTICSSQRDWNKMIFGPFQPEPFYDATKQFALALTALKSKSNHYPYVS